MNAQDEAHLGLISVFHYVLAGLYFLGIGFVILHFMIMSMVFWVAESEFHKTPPAAVALALETPPSATPGVVVMQEILPAPAPPATVKPNPFPKEIIPFFIGIYVIISLFLVTMCICNVLSGLFIRKRKNRMFSFVVLSRVSVKMEYDERLTG